MAFEGYLISIGGWRVPLEYIRPESYTVTDGKEKLTEWKDYNNERHTVYAKKTQVNISFDTSKNFRLSDTEVAQFNEALNAAKKIGTVFTPDSYEVRYYNPQSGIYETKYFTLEPLKFDIWGCNDNAIYFNPLKFDFREVCLTK